MPYLGNTPATQFSTTEYQDLTGGSGTSFTLDHVVGTAQEIEVFVNNVRQEPGVAYTVSGTTLTMTGSVAATDDFYVVFQGKANSSVAHPSNTTLVVPDGTASNPSITNNGDTNTGIFFPAADTIGFAEGGSEAMRIDSSGNLLVGTTTTNPAGNNTVGIELKSSDGRLSASRENSHAVRLNRKSSDGDIAVFYKDGTTVGSIGAKSGGLFIGGALGSDAYLFMGNNVIKAADSTGSGRHGAISLGDTYSSFKDLYLSGGVYLGGTGSANKLDDYEEGTFTPTLTGVTGGVTYANQQGRYTKIGDLVYWMFYMDITLSSATGANIRMVFPFADTATSGTYGTALMLHRASGLNISSTVIPNIRLMSYSGGTNYYFYDQTNGGVYNGIGNFTSGTIAASGVSKVN